MKIVRLALLVILAVTAAGFYPFSSAQAQGMCPLIDVSGPAQPNGEGPGEGMGGSWQGYLEAGTVVEYYMHYDGEGGGGIQIWLGVPWDGGTLVYSADGPSPVSGSTTLGDAGNYWIDAGAGTDQEPTGAMVTVLVEATCQGSTTDLTCTQLVSQSGGHCVVEEFSPEAQCINETGFCAEAYVEAGTILTLLAESASGECPVEGNIHFGEGDPLGQARGIGSGSVTILAPESGTYMFCAGGILAEDPCAYETVTLTAFSGCDIVAAVGCQAMMDMPSTAVVGAFVAETRAYWTPGALIEPEVVFEAGKTAWVLGVDETGEYYKIVWGCSYLWVPVSSMGPNYDEVWNGTPLPTDVVS